MAPVLIATRELKVMRVSGKGEEGKGKVGLMERALKLGEKRFLECKSPWGHQQKFKDKVGLHEEGQFGSLVESLLSFEFCGLVHQTV